MANTYLIELSPNDAIQDIVRKSNANFKRLAFDQTQNTNGSVRREATRADEALGNAIADINIAIENAKQELSTMVENTKQEFTQMLADARKEILDQLDSIDVAPPVGTYIYALYDPNEQWSDTTWERISEGNFLIAAGDTYLVGNPYGANTHTLTIAEMPSHGHRESTEILQWSNRGNRDLVSGNTVGGGNFRYPSYTFNTGGSQPHNNIPQSIAVPLWKRTA